MFMLTRSAIALKARDFPLSFASINSSRGLKVKHNNSTRTFPRNQIFIIVSFVEKILGRQREYQSDKNINNCFLDEHREQKRLSLRRVSGMRFVKL